MLFSEESVVLIIEPSAPKRSMLVSVLKSQEIGKIHGVGSIKDAISQMEVEQINWIIAPVLTAEDPNSLSLLLLIIDNPSLKHIKVSFLVEDKHHEILSFSYEKGLFCHFTSPFNKDSLVGEVINLKTLYSEESGDTTRVSASYIRKFFNEKSHWEPLIELNNSILDLYPGDYESYLSLGKSYFKKGDKDNAKKSLLQAFLIDQKYPDDINDMLTELQIDPESLSSSEELAKLEISPLSVESCVYVGEKEENFKKLDSILGPLGVKKIEHFTDGEKALEAMKSNTPNLLFIQWAVPGLPAPMLLQRLKFESGSPPIIVLGDGFAKDDKELMKEMGITAVLKENYERGELIETTLYGLRQYYHPTEAAVMETKIRGFLKRKEYKKANTLFQDYRQLDSISDARKQMIEAEFAYVEQNYQKARDLTIQAIKGETDTVYLVNLLGKCFLKLNDHEASLRCFEKAQSLSPKNIERLCNIAIVSTQTEDNEKKEESLKQAKELDANNETVKESEASIRVMEGNTEQAKKLMEELESLDTVIAFMNNQAVSYAKNNEAEKSIKIYEDTIASIPDKKIETKAAVMFNLAFANLRLDKLEEAVKHLEETVNLKSKKITDKANRVLGKVKLALKNGSPLKIAGYKDDAGAKKKDAEGEESNSEGISVLDRTDILGTVSIKPGEHCCFRLFSLNTPLSEEIKKLSAKLPRFVKRKNIERSETGGLEKAIKSQAS
ncbi:MAG: tetratricopeptide repeat protein [Oligoflexales bacterium]